MLIAVQDEVHFLDEQCIKDVLADRARCADEADAEPMDRHDDPADPRGPRPVDRLRSPLVMAGGDRVLPPTIRKEGLVGAALGRQRAGLPRTDIAEELLPVFT